MQPEDARHLEHIFEKVSLGKATLFLGAGASVSAGAPDSETLIQKLKDRFRNVHTNATDLFSVCQDIVETAPFGRNELEAFIRSQFETLEPTSAHFSMAKYDWQAIFTTNYDRLIELAYGKPERKRVCHPIYSPDFNANLFDRDILYLFKLMGCVSSTGEMGRMVITRSDYNRMLRERPRFVDCLHDVLKDGAVVFIGYSGGDFLVFELIDELVDKYGIDQLSYNYFLLPDAKRLSDIEQERLRRRKLLPISCSFEEFFRHLDSIPVRVFEPVKTGFQMQIRGATLTFDAQEHRNVSGYFEVLNDKVISGDPGDRDEFFRGVNRNWPAFKEKWDFVRSVYSDPDKGLKSRIFAELEKTDPADNKIIFLTGLAGVGKSIIARRLAYDVYESGLAPVIFLDPNRDTFDFKILESSLRSLIRQFDDLSKESTRRQLKALILVDDAPLLPWDVRHIRELLISRRIPAVIVAGGRDNEWELSIGKELPSEDTYRIQETLDEQERLLLLQHLNRIGYHVSVDDLITIIDREEKSFFATMYTLVHPSRIALDKIIKDQRSKLMGLARRAFDLVCVTHQFALPLPTELLVRSLGCSFEDFKRTLEGDARGVIFELKDRNDNLLCVTHHRIIASRTVEFFIGDSELQKKWFLEILSNCQFYNQIERDIIERLMVTCLGYESKLSNLSYEQKRELFSRICDRQPTRCLIHHWALLEMSQAKYAEAEELFLRALGFRTSFFENLREESEQNILTSLGNNYFRWGMELLLKGDSMSADKLFTLAETHFERGRRGGIPNPHAYHAHAYMYKKRAEREPDAVQRLEYLSRSLKIISEARYNLSSDLLLPLHILEMDVYHALGYEKEISNMIDDLSKKTQTGLGYFLYASIIRRDAIDKTGILKEKTLEKAIQEASKGVEKFPTDGSCLELRAELYGQLQGANLQKYFDYLKEWYDNVPERSNIRLLHELGRIAFELGLYDDSFRVFRELERTSRRHSRRFVVTNYLLDRERGEKRVFEGVVASIGGPYDGEITCNSLPKLRRNLQFVPISCDFTPSRGDIVAFNIGFDLVSPKAICIRKMG